jgi:7-keto-8-aminopelargonate synthetase-like enzyme
MNFLTDQRIKDIWTNLNRSRELQLTQNYADDVPSTGRFISVDGKERINFVTCSYLGLELDRRLRSGVTEAVRQYGVSFSASRAFLSSPLFKQFEGLLEQIFEAYPVVTSTTTLGHFSFMSVMIQPGDVIILDQQVHNSVQLAAQVVRGKAKLVPVRHNDMAKLEQLVQKYSADPATNHIWYFGDGVYSMFGDVAPVSDLVGLLQKYDRFYCYLDDAHGMSSQGKHGRGYVLSQVERLHPRMCVAVSLAKCFGLGAGAAIVMPNAEWQDMVRTCGATMIFSGPMPLPLIGAGIASAKIHLSDEMPRLHDELHRRIAFFRSEAEAAGIQLASSPLSPVQYVMVGEQHRAGAAAKTLFDAGFLMSVCSYPAVGINHAGLRLTLTRHVTEDDIQQVVGMLSHALQELAVA